MAKDENKCDICQDGHGRPTESEHGTIFACYDCVLYAHESVGIDIKQKDILKSGKSTE